MQTQFILRLALALLVIEYVYADSADLRGDFELKLLPQNQELLLDDSNELSLILKKWGIILDEESEVFIHHEESFINLDCFNCIISNLDHNEEVQHSFNLRQIGK